MKRCVRCGCAVAGLGKYCDYCAGEHRRQAAAEEAERAAERQGIACPDCGCTWLTVWYTRRRLNRIIRQRVCQHCGRKVMTYERIR